jgi:hypothetical protein
MATLASLIVSVRNLLNDGATSYFVKEDLFSQTDANKTAIRFKTTCRNIVAYVDNLLVTPTSPVASTGIFTLAVAPKTSLSTEYFYNLATDAEYTEALNSAAEETVGAATDPTTIPAGLVTALKKFALANMAGKFADQSAWFYLARSGDKEFDKDKISKKFLDLQTAYYKQATDAREGFYKRLGAREAPSSGIANYGIQPYGPRR